MNKALSDRHEAHPPITEEGSQYANLMAMTPERGHDRLALAVMLPISLGDFSDGPGFLLFSGQGPEGQAADHDDTAAATAATPLLRDGTTGRNRRMTHGHTGPGQPGGYLLDTGVGTQGGKESGWIVHVIQGLGFRN